MDWYLFVLGGFFLAAFVGFLAWKRGRSALLFFVVSLIFSPLIGLLIVLLLGKSQEGLIIQKLASGKYKKCPHCAELMKVDAQICPYCGEKSSQALTDYRDHDLKRKSLNIGHVLESEDGTFFAYGRSFSSKKEAQDFLDSSQ